MAEVNSVSEKADKVMDAVESKLAADGTAGMDEEKSLTNSHVDKDDKHNGHEEHATEEAASDDKKDLNPAESSGSKEEKPAETVPSASKTDVESKEESAKDADNVETKEDESGKKATASKKPAARGRAAPKGKRGAAARGKGKEETESAPSDAQNESDKAQPETKSSEPEKKPSETEEEKKQEAEEEPEKAPKKGGRKRGPAKEPEAKAAKVAKGDEDGPSGAQQPATDEKKTPLLETPLIIEGKRQRQKVERLDSKMLAVQTHKEVAELPQGSGTKLGDIPFVEAMISKTPAVDLKPLHRLCFGRAGTNHEIRKHMRTFCGFDFGKGTDAYTKKWKQMDNWGTKQLKQICEILGLERSGKKEELQTVIMDFLVKPSDSGRKVPQPKKKKGAAGKKRSASAAKGRAKKGKESSGEASESDDGAASEESGHKDDDEEKEESEPEPPKAKRAKKAPAKKETAAADTATTSKKAPRGKAASKPAKKSPPTDDALKTTIKDLLKGANLEEITMRDMCRKVYAKYPDFDLSPRKDFIKNTVKSIISSATE